MINYDAMEDHETFVPHHMRDGYKLWIEHKISPGSFGMSILSNDLKGAYVCLRHGFVRKIYSMEKDKEESQ